MADSDVESEGRVRSYLASHGGSVEDAGGRGLTDEMARAIGVDRPAVLSAILGQMERDGVITREMRGLRTYRIALTSGEEPALVAAEAGPAVADTGGSSRAGRRAGGRMVSLRESHGDEPTPIEAPDAPRRAVVSLRDALSRRPAVGAAAAGSAEPAGPGASGPVAGQSAVDTAPGEVTDQAPDAAVSLRDALKRTANAPPAAAPAARTITGIDAPSGSPSRAMSLREALAVKDATEAPEAGYTSTRQMPARSIPPEPDIPAPTFHRLREPAVQSPLDDDPGGRARKATKARKTPMARKADKPTRADKSAKKAERRRRLRSQLTMPVPAVKAPPSASIVTAVGVALAGLVLVAVISVVVSRGSSHHVVSNDPVSSSTDACSVVSPEMATALFGQAAGQPHFVLDSCVYDDGAHELIVVVYRSNARALFDAGRSTSAEDIPGIGDGAYYVDGRLRALKGNSLVMVALGPVPANTPGPRLLVLANTAVGRL